MVKSEKSVLSLGEMFITKTAISKLSINEIAEGISGHQNRRWLISDQPKRRWFARKERAVLQSFQKVGGEHDVRIVTMINGGRRTVIMLESDPVDFLN